MQPIINVTLRKDKIIDGKCAIVLQVYHKGKRKQKFVGIYVKEDNFKNGRVINVQNKDSLNRLITKEKNELESLYLTQQIEQGNIELSGEKNSNRQDFFTYAYAYYNGMRNRNSKDYVNRCIYCIKEFHQFAGKRSFQSITHDLLKSFEDHLYKKVLRNGKKGMSGNNINKIFKKIKQVFIEAGVPWKYKAVSYKQPKRDFLTMDEVEEIEKKGTDHVVKWYFLLSCYTGLRYGDMKGILTKLVKNRGVYRLILATTKTDEVVSIEVSEKVLSILNKLTKPIPSNVHTNRKLRDIIAPTSVKRHVTFHIGRHSFAVNSASMEFPIEVVGRLLGHKSIRTTEIYYKITNTKVDEWMKKWRY